MSITKLSENADLESALQAFVSEGHNAHLGMLVRGHGKGWVEFEVPWRAELTRGADGILDPGAIYSVMDAACAMTVWAKQGFFAPYPTIDFRIDYLCRPRPGAGVVARGECYALTPDYAFMRGIAHQGDPADPIAHSSGTFMSYKARP